MSDRPLPMVLISAKVDRGYGFDYISPEISEGQIESIARNWAPTGQGWRQLLGVRFVRIIPLPDNSVGWVELQVAEDQDEFGRSGLLRAEVSVAPRELATTLAHNHLSKLPIPIINASKRYMPGVAGLYWRAFWRMQTVVAAPLSFINKWSLIEAIVLRSFLALPRFIQSSATFTTLCLSPSNMGTIIGMPLEYLKRKAHVILR